MGYGDKRRWNQEEEGVRETERWGWGYKGFISEGNQCSAIKIKLMDNDVRLADLD